MRSPRCSVIALAVLMAACQTQSAPPEEVTAEADHEAIRTLETEIYAAENAGNLDAFMSFVDEDPVWLPPNESAITDRQAIREWIRPYLEDYDILEEATGQEVRVLGDWGYIRAHWTFAMIPKAGGETITDEGKSIWIVRRQDDGTWRISRAIWNSDNPVPQAE